jgi:hypothetical protein
MRLRDRTCAADGQESQEIYRWSAAESARRGRASAIALTGVLFDGLNPTVLPPPAAVDYRVALMARPSGHRR